VGTVFDDQDRGEVRGGLHRVKTYGLGGDGQDWRVNVRRFATSFPARPLLARCWTAGLESSRSHRLLLCVQALPVSTSPTSSIVVGTVASAATTGALIAAGRRLGSAGIPFAEISSALFHRTPSGGEVGLVFSGVVLHVAVTMLWSAAFVWLVRRARWRRIFAAVVVACASLVLSWLIAWSTGRGVATVLPLGDRIVVSVVLAISLV